MRDFLSKFDDSISTGGATPVCMKSPHTRPFTLEPSTLLSGLAGPTLRTVPSQARSFAFDGQ